MTDTTTATELIEAMKQCGPEGYESIGRFSVYADDIEWGNPKAISCTDLGLTQAFYFVPKDVANLSREQIDGWAQDRTRDIEDARIDLHVLKDVWEQMPTDRDANDDADDAWHEGQS